jgi:hypothetical protein
LLLTFFLHPKTPSRRQFLYLRPIPSCCMVFHGLLLLVWAGGLSPASEGPSQLYIRLPNCQVLGDGKVYTELDGTLKIQGDNVLQVGIAGQLIGGRRRL